MFKSAPMEYTYFLNASFAILHTLLRSS